MGKWAQGTTAVALITVGLTGLATGVSYAGAADNPTKAVDTALADAGASMPGGDSGALMPGVGSTKPTTDARSTAVHEHRYDHGRRMVTSGYGSLLSGNQVHLPISVPINVGGNAITAVGTAAASEGEATVRNDDPDRSGTHSSDDFSVLGGNQVDTPVSVPINICGDAVSILGDAKAGCHGGAHVHNRGTSGGMKSPGNFSVLGGNRVNAPVSVPINVCADAVSVLGAAKATCTTSATVRNEGGEHSGSDTSGDFSLGDGNQLNLPVSVPINICGNTISLLGVSEALCVEHRNFPPPCDDHDCPPPPCESHHCPPPPCKDHHCPPPPCREDHCPPPPCESDHCAPPPHHHHGHEHGNGNENEHHGREHEAAGELPFTGGPFGTLAEVGMLLVGAGGLLLGSRRLGYKGRHSQ